MVEFKVVVNDTKGGKSYTIPVSGHHANSLIGKKINDEVDGIFVSLPGYKLQITGGTDKDGFPMHSQVQGQVRKKVLLSQPPGFHPTKKGERRRKIVRGDTLSADIMQINVKITKKGEKSIDQIIPQKPKVKKEEVKEEKKEQKVEEKKEVKGEKKSEQKEVKEEAKEVKEPTKIAGGEQSKK
jgi:small subunit ribosomal protein S6e